MAKDFTLTQLGKKYAALQQQLTKLIPDGVLIAFSGGVDSAFLLWAAQKLVKHGQVMAVTTISPSLPDQDKADTQRFIDEFKIRHLWVESQEMVNPDYTKNDGLRCYHCKSELFNQAQKIATKNRLKWILYGYNASDISDVRPGHKAALENGVLAPLESCGLQKEEIRSLLHKEKIFLADKPASPCLSSRVSQGIPITAGRLADIMHMENLLKKAGLSIFRVRVNETGKELFLRIEVNPEEVAAVLPVMDLLNEAGRARGYRWVTLDLAGYKTGGANK